MGLTLGLGLGLGLGLTTCGHSAMGHAGPDAALGGVEGGRVGLEQLVPRLVRARARVRVRVLVLGRVLGLGLSS